MIIFFFLPTMDRSPHKPGASNAFGRQQRSSLEVVPVPETLIPSRSIGRPIDGMIKSLASICCILPKSLGLPTIHTVEVQLQTCRWIQLESAKHKEKSKATKK